MVGEKSSWSPTKSMVVNLYVLRCCVREDRNLSKSESRYSPSCYLRILFTLTLRSTYCFVVNCRRNVGWQVPLKAILKNDLPLKLTGSFQWLNLLSLSRKDMSTELNSTYSFVHASVASIGRGMFNTFRLPLKSNTSSIFASKRLSSKLSLFGKKFNGSPPQLGEKRNHQKTFYRRLGN